jgi:hypothetical protein
LDLVAIFLDAAFAALIVGFFEARDFLGERIFVAAFFGDAGDVSFLNVLFFKPGLTLRDVAPRPLRGLVAFFDSPDILI